LLKTLGPFLGISVDPDDFTLDIYLFGTLDHNMDPKIMELLREIGRLKIDDSCAQSEWGWHIDYPLEEMVDDFIKEFNENRSWYVS